MFQIMIEAYIIAIQANGSYEVRVFNMFNETELNILKHYYQCIIRHIIIAKLTIIGSILVVITKEMVLEELE